MNDKPRFTVYDVTVEQWTARFGVEPVSHPCSECGRMCTTTIPFVQGTLRGLAAPPCVCGNRKTPYAMVREPPSPDEIALLTELALRDLRDPEPVAYREPTTQDTDPSAYDSFRTTLGDECGRLREENAALLAENATLRRRLETYERKRR